MCKAIAANCVSANMGRITFAVQFTRLIVAIQNASALTKFLNTVSILASQLVLTDPSYGRNVDALGCNPRQQLRKSQKNYGP